ncbi:MULTISPECIES: hypothetical protein [Pasteurellaceae]|uniref:hypothetical protein n=1 Tax=Pasteurellaceae TaxID=712 RepID=UPI0035664018
MRLKYFFLSFLISGCYLANGSPPSSYYWLKSGNKITYTDMQYCQNKIYEKLGRHFLYLKNKQESEGWSNMIDNFPLEYQEYSQYLENAKPLISRCYFDLGYRFTAPYYWCIAESNMDTCKINQKYR